MQLFHEGVVEREKGLLKEVLDLVNQPEVEGGKDDFSKI